ncbi:hypothetical protein NPIL_225421 [Nephila pilipes]|uniref:Uncharacterized protein n=1 Tax=Nephila pilipes TaxID=299642 RepID=A0A8X6NR42_NEPPI|nr:hypothetical protein NPIL_225421 [Nephila pilipes]
MGKYIVVDGRRQTDERHMRVSKVQIHASIKCWMRCRRRLNAYTRVLRFCVKEETRHVALRRPSGIYRGEWFEQERCTASFQHISEET